jgi:ribosome-binding ATPase
MAGSIMGFKCGIVGLPNVGKSTLFNALTATAAAAAANYPFCTIEPNVGRVAVPDDRLDKIAVIAGTKVIIPTQLEFVDIAGLVRGASKGEGLGNQFLAHIRETDAIAHVLRCFEEGDITHVEGNVDPLRDAEIIETELMLADLESLQRRQSALEKKAKGGDKEAKIQLTVLEQALALLADGKPARLLKLDGDEKRALELMQLITARPVLFVANVAEEQAATGNALSAAVEAMAKAQGAACVVIAAEVEAQIAQVQDAAERAEFQTAMGLTEPGLNRLIRAGHELLGLETYFTAGVKEARAWTILKGSKGPQAAAVIHSDFERGFIAVETIAYADYIACNGEAGAKEQGKLRLEGRDYVVQDGDVLHFRFNV